MSILSSAYRRNKGVIRKIGKGIDFASDFLPPGFRDVGNFGSKLIQGQGLKKAAFGTAMDYGVGRVVRGLGAGAKAAKGGGSVAAGAVPRTAAKVIGIGPGGIPLIDQTGSITRQLAGSALKETGKNMGRASIISGLKRGLRGLTGRDIATGAMTGYGIYNQGKQDKRDNRRQDMVDKYALEDRARKIRLQDIDRITEAEDRARTIRLDEEDRARLGGERARRTRLEDDQLGRDAQDRTADAEWFNQLAPFRQAGQRGLLAPAPVDYSSIFAQPPQPPITYAPVPVRRPLR